jgi:hypothetical protein
MGNVGQWPVALGERKSWPATNPAEQRKNSLVVIQFPESLLQVTNTTVYQLSTLTRSSGTEIVTLNHSDLQASRRSIESDTGAGSTGTNHQQVIRLFFFFLTLLQVLDLFEARFDEREAGRNQLTLVISGGRNCGCFETGNITRTVGDVENARSGGGCRGGVEQRSQKLARMTSGHYPGAMCRMTGEVEVEVSELRKRIARINWKGTEVWEGFVVMRTRCDGSGE